MANGAGGRPKGSLDNPYNKRKQRQEPTDAERKQAAKRAAKTRALLSSRFVFVVLLLLRAEQY